MNSPTIPDDIRPKNIVNATSGKEGDESFVELEYVTDQMIGNGSFGVVYQANLFSPTNEMIAIKKVLQDKRYKNRELQIMRLVQHQNVVELKYFFYTVSNKEHEIYLNLVLEFVPDTAYRVNRHYRKDKEKMPMIYVKLYTYQVCRALGYLHSLNVCHRDIKPQNLLVDQVTGMLKVCDFGSAKILGHDEPNVSYICSRYYRAPELIFGSSDYTTAVDMWSVGCVFDELLGSCTLFPGDSGVGQLVEIIKIMGTPNENEIRTMNPNYDQCKLPEVKPCPLVEVFGEDTPAAALALLDQCLRYSPKERVTPLEACCHSFFDDLRNPSTRLPNGQHLPASLMKFTERELGIQPELERIAQQLAAIDHEMRQNTAVEIGKEM